MAGRMNRFNNAQGSGALASFDPSAVIPARHYRRWIEGASLSLEANTPSTPTEDVYFVFQKGVVCFSSDSLAEAEEVFDRLRAGHWEDLLASLDRQERLDGARGLFRLDHTHVRACEILTAEGSDQDIKRIAQARHRARYAARNAR
jgi:hypothetical protein